MTDFVLASDIPDIKLNILVGNGLNIEPTIDKSAEDTTWGSGSHLLVWW